MVSSLYVLLDEFTPFSDDGLYNEVPFFPLVFPLGRLSKGEYLAVYTSACNQKDRFLTVVWKRILTVRTSLSRHPHIKIFLYLRLLSWSGLCVPISTTAPAGRWRGYPLREPR